MRRSCSGIVVGAGIVVGIVLGVGTANPAHAEPLTVTFVHVNDWDRMEPDEGRGGAARIATVVRAERARAQANGALAVVTFGGDMISPSVLSGIDRGAHMIDLANAIGFDVAVPGNHEFDFGPEVLRERLAESGALWLASNLEYRGRPGFPGTNGGGIRGGRVYPAGTEITPRVLITELPFGKATNDFMLTGGDGYGVLQSGEVLIDASAGDSMANHLIEFVRAAGTVSPGIEGRIVRED